MSIACVRCQKDFHAECVGLSVVEIDFLNEGAEKWACHLCGSQERRLRSNSSSSRHALLPSPQPSQSLSDGDMPITAQHFNALMDSIQKIAASVERIEKRQDDLFNQLADCTAAIHEHSSILSKHQNAIDGCQSEIASLHRANSTLRDEVAAVTSRLDASSACPSERNDVTEILSRVEKSHNLIITNVTEKADIALDTASVHNIVEHIRKGAGQFLLKSSRLPSKDSSKPRWIRAVFSSPECVRDILRNKSKLRGHPDFRHVTIYDDKTREQVSFLNALRTELRRRQAAGETNLTIKYLQGVPTIVTSSKFSNKTSKN